MRASAGEIRVAPTGRRVRFREPPGRARGGRTRVARHCDEGGGGRGGRRVARVRVWA